LASAAEMHVDDTYDGSEADAAAVSLLHRRIVLGHQNSIIMTKLVYVSIITAAQDY
jgi:hypothetical protein